MTIKYLVRLATKHPLYSVSVFLSAPAARAIAESPSYPWCAQGSVIRCRYMTREQCEEAVNYHGFCVTDPNVPRRYGETLRG